MDLSSGVALSSPCLPPCRSPRSEAGGASKNLEATLTNDEEDIRGAEPPEALGGGERFLSKFEMAPWGAGPRNQFASERQDSVRQNLCPLRSRGRLRDLCPRRPGGVFLRSLVVGRLLVRGRSSSIMTRKFPNMCGSAVGERAIANLRSVLDR